MNTTFTIIFFAVNIPPCVAALIAALNYKKIDRKLTSLKLYIFFAALMQLIQLVLWFKNIHNLFLLHFFVPVEFILLAHFYQSILQNLINRRIILTTTILFVIFSIVNTLFFQKISTFNSNALVTEDVIITTMSIATFIILLNRRSGLNKPPIGQALSWINSGIFINFSTTLVLFYFSNYLIAHLSNNVFSYIAWLFNDAATVTMHCCFIVGILKNIKLNEQR
ncbi:hypothetical protein ACFGVR_01540 [Mucilaginibacter sp. AW1-3]